jgi:phage baseplate assembly protein W
MSYINSIIAASSRYSSSNTRQYQPQFPLRYDPVFGPYQPIVSEQESLQKDFEILLLTNPGEWPMNPELGIGLKHYLFENYDSSKLQGLKPRIQNQLMRFLPTVQILSVNWNASDHEKDEGFVTIILSYSILSGDPRELVIKEYGRGNTQTLQLQSNTANSPANTDRRSPLESDQVTI